MAFEFDRNRRHHADQDQQDTETAAPRTAGVPDLGKVVQAKGQVVSTDEAQVKSDAAAGVAGSGDALPHLDTIQRAFGADHDVSGVRAHVGGDAAKASQAMGAEAYATGNSVAFQKSPDLHLAAHEAAHVVQQREGVSLKGGVGASGDAYEQQADAVADRVVAGESAADLLPKNGGNDAADPSVQRYVNKQVKGQSARVSETGNTVVLGDSGYSQHLYATDTLIAQSNKLLAASGDKGSYIRLQKNGDDVKAGDKELHCVRPVFQPEGDQNNKELEKENKGKDADDTMALWADCGRSSRAVMGSHGDAAPHATYKAGGKEKETGDAYNPAKFSDQIYLDAMPGFLRNPEHKQFLKSGTHYNGEDKEDLIVPTSADQARTQYWELGEDGRRRFDQATGINTGANPHVGGGYTMNTEYNMPGFKEMARNTWNFHWAGVVMKDGSDNITLENYADGNGYDSVNMDWNYQMYGTVKKGQTFQEEHLDSNTHGSRASTFAVEAKGD
jgi:hypothetical protein